MYYWISLISFPEPGVTQLPPPAPGDTIWRFDVPTQSLIPSVFDDLDNAWFLGAGRPGPPTTIGKSFFYQANDRNLPLPPSSQETVSVGMIYFSTLVPQAGVPVPSELKSNGFIEDDWLPVNARITWEDGTGIGQGFTAQLYGGSGGTPIDQLVPLTPPTTFQTESAAMRGYVNPVLTSVPASAGRPITLIMRVFDGESYEASVVRGESNPITIRQGGEISLPANLVGLEGFSISAPVGARRTIGVERTPAGLKLTFAGTLQSADVVTGPYSDVAEASSPANILFSGTTKFYRVKPGE